MSDRKIQIALPVTGEEEWHAAKDPIYSGWLTSGPKVREFEENFAKHHEAKFGIATTSCTTGLHLILAAMGIGPGDEVIVPSFTWVSTANVVLHCGATPVLVDVDLETFNIDPEAVKAAITSKTKAIYAVDLFGLCADYDALVKVAGDIPVLEDAACAAGARYKGRWSGTLGLAGAYSFHPRKSITTGEGGMVLTNNEALAEKMQMIRNHGASLSEEQRHLGPKPYLLPEFNLLGYNYRMTDLQAAIGLVQLKKLEGFISERAKWAKYYADELSSVEWLRTPNEPEGGRHAWQAFVCFVDESKSPLKRNDLMEKLQELGISTRPGTHAIHQLGYYKEQFSLTDEQFPRATLAANCSMAIPLHNKMTEDDYAYVVEKLKGF